MNSPSTAPRPLVVLTGATGFLGSHIADLLLARGYAVRATVRPTSDTRWLQGKRVELVEAPLAGPPAALAPLLDGAGAVVHCAGVVRAPNEERYRAGNVDTTRALRDAAAAAGGVRCFVLISSLAAAGPSTPARPRVEADPCAPVSAYGRAKLEAESLLQSGLPFRAPILRPPALYGPRDASFLPLFRLARAGWALRPQAPLRALSLAHGRDAARATLALLETETAAGPYFVEDGQAHGWNDLARALGPAFGRRLLPLPIPLAAARAAARLLGARRSERSAVLNRDRLQTLAASAWTCSGARLRAETGFAPEFDLAAGFRDTLAWYRERGWL